MLAQLKDTSICWEKNHLFFFTTNLVSQLKVPAKSNQNNCWLVLGQLKNKVSTEKKKKKSSFFATVENFCINIKYLLKTSSLFFFTAYFVRKLKIPAQSN